MGLKFAYAEPVPKFAAELRKKGCRVFQAAVCGRRGIASFNVAKVSERSSLYGAPEDVMEVAETVEVNCVTLADVQRGFDGLAIDAQGATWEILSSGKLDFKAIVCEASEAPRYFGEKPRSEIEGLLRENGYELVGEYKHKNLDVYDLAWRKKK